ncbi:tRNA (guanosine(46)-N7)-methyltransferase TrmB [Pseudoalteromonas sp. CnMc7-15]|uniref:tRNA (guanosine(46)-N7)-methyltransferase TrmB n=1 Tax=unclassified Pseudoalteromonas TaxID=194690 RepID=UPI001EF3E832|nr:tRNA (guanosine(46)-N7)-methyltransferase TrmB [Pseudoalteromonas sp. CnMc7-15]MCG7567744.1 tRNA (guanosine(46)-N7)-methyltransferase TrmB [Pseudoalteromonas sp. CnMc7-15]
MSESTQQALEQAQREGKYIRKVRSFVKREGRLTKGQAAALEKCWPTMGLEHQNGLLDFSQVFGNDNDVVLEIGFGMGKSLVEMAKNAPEQNFIGIEVHRPGVGACLMDADAEGVTNLRVFEHDAVEVLADCISDESLAKVQLFFPDPWHKKRHHKRRIVQPEFVENLRSKLKIGGVFHMATDWQNYAGHMLEVMQGNSHFSNQSSTNDYVPRPDFRPLTKFEQRGHRLGHGVWDLMFERVK